MKVADITNYLGEQIPVGYQESYDNSGLQVGDSQLETGMAILTLDVTEDVVDEAVEAGAGLIISHHPLIFSGLKSITGKNAVEKTVVRAIKNGIAIYSAHTNLDVIPGGVSYRMAEKLGIKNVIPLMPLAGRLAKIALFVPAAHAEAVRMAMFKAGAGCIGNYDHCSFNSDGIGTFRPGDNTNPFTGNRGEDHAEPEVKIETVMPRHLVPGIVKAMIQAHPYEEVAYDIYNIENSIPGAGLGVVGELAEPLGSDAFFELLRSSFGLEGLRYGKSNTTSVSRVALCGGSGSSLVNYAISAGADAFVTGDIKYHSFMDASETIMLIDIGHYESEKFSLEILYEIITKKFPKFAVRFSKINTNPVNYLPAWKK